MNIDLLKIIKLVFAICDDTQIRENKTFQIARDVVNAIEPSPGDNPVPQSPAATEISNFKSQISPAPEASNQ